MCPVLIGYDDHVKSRAWLHGDSKSLTFARAESLTVATNLFDR